MNNLTNKLLSRTMYLAQYKASQAIKRAEQCDEESATLVNASILANEDVVNKVLIQAAKAKGRRGERLIRTSNEFKDSAQELSRLIER